MRPVAGTIPYAWPYDGHLDPAHTALVITGAQRAWQMMSTDAGAGEVRTRITEILPALRRSGVLVVALTHIRDAWASPSAGPGRSVVPLAGSSEASTISFGDGGVGSIVDVTVVARGLDGFYGSALEHVLRSAGRTHLLMAGFASEITLDSTLRGANDRGFECLVLTDALAPVAPEISDRVLASVTMSGGIFGALGISTAVLDALGE